MYHLFIYIRLPFPESQRQALSAHLALVICKGKLCQAGCYSYTFQFWILCLLLLYPKWKENLGTTLKQLLKGWHSIIMQGTVNHIIDIYVGWPGRVHDARVFLYELIEGKWYTVVDPHRYH